jgi:hypothetical protein
MMGWLFPDLRLFLQKKVIGIARPKVNKEVNFKFSFWTGINSPWTPEPGQQIPMSTC